MIERGYFFRKILHGILFNILSPFTPCIRFGYFRVGFKVIGFQSDSAWPHEGKGVHKYGVLQNAFTIRAWYHFKISDTSTLKVILLQILLKVVKSELLYKLYSIMCGITSAVPQQWWSLWITSLSKTNTVPKFISEVSAFALYRALACFKTSKAFLLDICYVNVL